MASNMFMPKGLPLLSDAALIKTMAEYGKSYAALAHSVFPSASRLRKEIGLAMLAIEQELEARGVPTPFVDQDVLPGTSPKLIEESTESIARHFNAVA
jgi:hypothetical protein